MSSDLKHFIHLLYICFLLALWAHSGLWDEVVTHQWLDLVDFNRARGHCLYNNFLDNELEGLMTYTNSHPLGHHLSHFLYPSIHMRIIWTGFDQPNKGKNGVRLLAGCDNAHFCSLIYIAYSSTMMAKKRELEL